VLIGDKEGVMKRLLFVFFLATAQEVSSDDFDEGFWRSP